MSCSVQSEPPDEQSPILEFQSPITEFAKSDLRSPLNEISPDVLRHETFDLLINPS